MEILSGIALYCIVSLYLDELFAVKLAFELGIQAYDT